ncbi:MAG: hypothetical protein ACLR0U_21820 [Enterocloster clostridioformis]
MPDKLMIEDYLREIPAGTGKGKQESTPMKGLPGTPTPTRTFGRTTCTDTILRATIQMPPIRRSKRTKALVGLTECRRMNFYPA